jgi:RNA-directed DNA polymerase
MKRIHNLYSQIISLENLLRAWKEFEKGKKYKPDVLEFSENLFDNIYKLHTDLKNFNYQHGSYENFKIFDPKEREINKAEVRDRLLHHAIYRILYPYFDKKFINDSYSCRNRKGTHKALNQFRRYFNKVSQNNTRTCYCLKLDIRKFFASINHVKLIEILNNNIYDHKLMRLLNNIIHSYHGVSGKGLPLGNLTSQLLINIYMNEFDYYIKYNLHEKYFLRYADDFVLLNRDYLYLQQSISVIKNYLKKYLDLDIHPDKIYIKTIASGVDFLGVITFTDHRIIRTKTKKRILKRVNKANKFSYLGILKHCNGYKIRKLIGA